MGKRKFSREFKIRLIAELRSKRASQVCREHGIAPDLLSRWRKEFEENPGNAFKGSGNVCKLEAQIAERDRLIGKLLLENEFLKKSIEKHLEQSAEERRCLK